MQFWKRRPLILLPLLSLALSCAPLWDLSRIEPRVYRIGYITAGTRSPQHDAFVDELSRLGYVVGENLTIVYRLGEGKADHLPAMARELVELNLDAIFANGEVAAQPLLESGATVPIVMVT